MNFNVDFSEVVTDPHYAFPVIGVLVCALLVFAFGFKSPVQPPSFEFEDERERKTSGTKKRKTLKKSQNGHAATLAETAVAKQPTEKPIKQAPEKQVVSPKAKSQKANKPATEKSEKHDNKQDIKNKKNEKNERNAQKKKEEKLSKPEPGKGNEEETGEWVQLLSRREKKNRKRDEVQVRSEDDEPKDNSSKEGTPEKKQNILITPPDSKENSPSKKKKKKNAKKIVEMEELIKSGNTESVEVVILEEIKKIEKPEKRIVEKQVQEIRLPEVDKKNTTGKKVSEVVEPIVTTSESKSKKKKNKSKPQTKETPKAELDTTQRAEAVECKEKVPQKKRDCDVILKKEVKADPLPNKENETAPAGGGVAFDELGDAWEEPKNQKKKKKARRDQ